MRVPSAKNRLTASFWLSMTRKTWSKPEKNWSSSPIEPERLAPRPATAWEESIIQVEKARRVFGSKARRISSSWTVLATCALGRVPPSGTVGPSWEPG